jgi:hypothetical protein
MSALTTPAPAMAAPNNAAFSRAPHCQPGSGAAADAELELAVGKEVCRRDFLGHVERVLVVDVDDTGAP